MFNPVFGINAWFTITDITPCYIINLNAVMRILSCIGHNREWVTEQCFPGFSKSFFLSYIKVFRWSRSPYSGAASSSIFVHICGNGPGPDGNTHLQDYIVSIDLSLNCWNNFFTQLSLQTKFMSSTWSSFGGIYFVPSIFSFVIPVSVTPSFFPIWESIMLEVNTLSFFWSALCSSISFKFRNFEIVWSTAWEFINLSISPSNLSTCFIIVSFEMLCIGNSQ